MAHGEKPLERRLGFRQVLAIVAGLDQRQVEAVQLTPHLGLRQEVDVKEYAGSQYTVGGFVSTDANDKGELVITFFDDQGTEVGAAKPKALGPSRLVWKEFKDTGQIPAGAVKARFELKGKAVGSGEVHADVFYDDVSFRCGEKVSGLDN